jgi:hypothetical protein
VAVMSIDKDESERFKEHQRDAVYIAELEAKVERLKEDRQVLLQALDEISLAKARMDAAMSTAGVLRARWEPAPPVVCDAMRVAVEAYGGDDEEGGD